MKCCPNLDGIGKLIWSNISTCWRQHPEYTFFFSNQQTIRTHLQRRREFVRWAQPRCQCQQLLHQNHWSHLLHQRQLCPWAVAKIADHRVFDHQLEMFMNRWNLFCGHNKLKRHLNYDFFFCEQSMNQPNTIINSNHHQQQTQQSHTQLEAQEMVHANVPYDHHHHHTLNAPNSYGIEIWSFLNIIWCEIEI